MRWLISLVCLVGLCFANPMAPQARACPMCKEAINTTNDMEEVYDDPFTEARAYNTSIYMMVGMPYLLLGTVGYLIYRHRKQRSTWSPLPDDPQLSAEQGDPSCPTPSRDETF